MKGWFFGCVITLLLGWGISELIRLDRADKQADQDHRDKVCTNFCHDRGGVLDWFGIHEKNGMAIWCVCTDGQQVRMR